MNLNSTFNHLYYRFHIINSETDIYKARLLLNNLSLKKAKLFNETPSRKRNNRDIVQAPVRSAQQVSLYTTSNSF